MLLGYTGKQNVLGSTDSRYFLYDGAQTFDIFILAAVVLIFDCWLI